MISLANEKVFGHIVQMPIDVKHVGYKWLYDWLKWNGAIHCEMTSLANKKKIWTCSPNT